MRRKFTHTKYSSFSVSAVGLSPFASFRINKKYSFQFIYLTYSSVYFSFFFSSFLARLCLPLTVFLFRYSVPSVATVSSTADARTFFAPRYCQCSRGKKLAFFAKIQNQIEMVYLVGSDVLRLGEIILAAISITKACNVASELCEERANELTQNDRSSAMRTNYWILRKYNQWWISITKHLLLESFFPFISLEFDT